jgi:hypothetical protein
MDLFRRCVTLLSSSKGLRSSRTGEDLEEHVDAESLEVASKSEISVVSGEVRDESVGEEHVIKGDCVDLGAGPSRRPR